MWMYKDGNPITRETIELMAEQISTLEGALKGMLDMYIELVDSGDAGHWDAEKVSEVIAARAALAFLERR